MGKRSKSRMAQKALAISKSKKRKFGDGDAAADDDTSDVARAGSSGDQPEHTISADHSSASHDSLKKAKKSKKARLQASEAAREADIQSSKNDVLNSLPAPPSLKQVLSTYPPMPSSGSAFAKEEPVDSKEASDALKSARKSLGIRVIGLCPPPLSWSPSSQPPPTVKRSAPSIFFDHLQKKSYISPTPVQLQLWPALLSSKNCIGIAPTGSGKTLAYALPLVHLISEYLTSSDIIHSSITNKTRKKIKSGELTYKGIFGNNFDSMDYWGEVSDCCSIIYYYSRAI